MSQDGPNFDYRPPSPELDPALYEEMVEAFTNLVLSPYSQPLKGKDNYLFWELLEPDQLDLEIGRKRVVSLVANGLKCEVEMQLFNESVGLFLDDGLVKRQLGDMHVDTIGAPIGYIFIATKDKREEFPWSRSYNLDGGIVGLLYLHQKPYADYDFGHGTVKSQNPLTQQALERFLDYLGLNRSLQVDGPSSEASQGGKFDNEGISKFTAGLRRLAETAGNIIET